MKRIIDFIAYSRKTKSMEKVSSIDLINEKFNILNEESLYSFSNTKIFQYTGRKDVQGNKIYDGSYVVGHMSWVKSDGYLKKDFPEKIKVMAKVVYENGKFDTEMIRVFPEHEKAYREKNYRGIGYSLSPASRDRKGKTGVIEAGVTCVNLTVVGHVRTDKKEIENN